MPSKTTRAAIAALLVAASTAALAVSANAADAPPKFTPAVASALQDAQKNVAAQKLPEALAAVKKAQAAATSDYDKLEVNRFLVAIDLQLNDKDGATAAGEAAAESPNIPAAEKKDVITNGAILAINAQHFEKAAKYAKLMEDMGLNDPKSQQIILQAYSFGGNTSGAAALAQKQIDAAIAAGQKPDRNMFEVLLNAQAKAKDEEGAEKTLEQLVVYYNDPHDWQQMIDIALSSRGLRDIDAIYLGRLLFATGVTVTKQNADLIGSTAAHLTFFGDAVNATKHGGTGFTVDNARIAADQKSMPQQIAAGQKQNGQYNVKLAEALYSYDMYPEAEAAARLAQTKGGATDPSEPAMVIGMSLVAEGKYDDAVTAFGQVQGGGPATPRIVRLWIAFAKNKANPPAAAATAAK